jgi:hypothetical protein
MILTEFLLLKDLNSKPSIAIQYNIILIITLLHRLVIVILLLLDCNMYMLLKSN